MAEKSTKTLKLKTYKNGEVGFDLQDLLEGTRTRVSTVKYYKIEKEEEGIIVTFYNKNKRKIKISLTQKQ